MDEIDLIVVLLITSMVVAPLMLWTCDTSCPKCGKDTQRVKEQQEFQAFVVITFDCEYCGNRWEICIYSASML